MQKAVAFVNIARVNVRFFINLSIKYFDTLNSKTIQGADQKKPNKKATSKNEKPNTI